MAEERNHYQEKRQFIYISHGSVSMVDHDHLVYFIWNSRRLFSNLIFTFALLSHTSLMGKVDIFLVILRFPKSLIPFLIQTEKM